MIELRGDVVGVRVAVKNTFRKTTTGSAVLSQVIRLLASVKGKNGAITTLLRPAPPDLHIVQELTMSHDSNAENKNMWERR